MLNTQISKVGTGTTFGSGLYWSSSEYSDFCNGAWYVYFYNGSVYFNGIKYDSTYRVRPLLAF